MSARNPLHNSAVRVFRATCAFVGILLLLLQMLGPALASPGQSMWVEICSEAGAVWVQVDLEEGTEDPTAPCPKCADCALCAATNAAPVPDLPELAGAAFTHAVECFAARQNTICESAWLWPETRGPPAAPAHKTERALRASMAPTQLPGGAPWS